VERRISSGPAHDIAPIPNPAPQTRCAGGPNPPPLGSELLRRLGPKPASRRSPGEEGAAARVCVGVECSGADGTGSREGVEFGA